MQPKLKENPREWMKFTLALSVALLIVGALAWKRGRLAFPGFATLAGVLAVADVLCLVRPRWFRGFYRAGMTIGFYIGQVVGRVLLTLVFVLVLTPLALGLRLAGKDLLKMRRGNRASYWMAAKPPGRLDRQF